MDDSLREKLRQLVRRAGEAMEKEPGPSGEEAGRILDQRARQLAGEAGATAAPPPGGTIDLVLFRLAGEVYAVESRHVLEVAPLKALTPIPGAPAFIAGVTNLRGRILDVVDLRTFFELPARGLTDLTRVVVLQGGGMEFGLLAETVSGALAFRADGLQGPLPTMSGPRAEFLRGIAPGGEIVLDAERLLADPRLVVNEDRQGESAC